MAIRVALNHRTKYRYPRGMFLSPHIVRLRPAPHCRTPITSYSLSVTPGEHFINWQQDPYSNRLARLVFPKKTNEFAVEVDLVAELTVINPFDFFLEKYAEHFPFTYDPTLARELEPYLHPEPGGPLLTALLGAVPRDKMATVDFLVGLNLRIHNAVKYLIRLEPGIQSAEETLIKQCGSCRDSAWLMVNVLRRLGLAARFVSGYLIQLVPDVKSLDGPSGASHDFTDLHAWTEVYLPGAGWVGMDPTSGLFAGEGHIPLACSADPVSAAAITGFYSADDESVTTADPDDAHGTNGQAKEEFEFSMSVTRIHEDPRVTKPYTDAQWSQIETLGHQIDQDLKHGDVRLTMGGEPTFVSIDDMDGPEWNTTAMGPMKYKRSDTLIRRLRDRFAPGGLLHFGQSKWYPGESLPRWALGLHWRKDGEPLWRDPALVADESATNTRTSADAEAFIMRLAQKLGTDEKYVIPGFEDAWYYLWKERRLPSNVDPLKSNLANAEDRARLAKVFEDGLEKVVGYALPLRRDYYTDGSAAWVTGKWFLRAERMYLIPGDSPMGLRLPLDSMPWVAKEDFPHIYERDPWEDRAPLSHSWSAQRQRHLTGEPGPRDPAGYSEQVLGPPGRLRERKPDTETTAFPTTAFSTSVSPPRAPADLEPAQGESAPWVVRTSLCTQVRQGVLRVFMPPQRYLEDYVDLVTAIEDTAAELKTPVLIEGYAPPSDPRINTIKVTPDPGVIEVNTQPVQNWDELVKNTTALYEEARLTRLGTEKFMLDGRHTGTGGGNHIVLGGPSPKDSPLLRRPDLLRSLIGYWHNHPSLSYLFSGLFVGPTSQAPRIDEARNDQVYELELAFKQIPAAGNCPPWIVDRVLRNILIDATGNTHRAEFCIDKLYAPESSTGRLGLLEMRAFEMPPHAQMSLTQHLLLRALVANFWVRPYNTPLVRWRTELHDRFMLPHFVRQDMEDVVADLNQAGYPFKLDWFDAHFEFRFPHYGAIAHRGIELELRQAIEPWNVLGEEPSLGGPVRFVDSSVERMQVLVDGMVDTRHVVMCNGVRVPLHPTGTNGQFVAGVRYRAWHPPSCLHPTIAAHAPLVFDLLDTWSGRSIGGCTYHVAHPGGRSYDRFPVNAYEAESRRIARFFKFGHTPGPLSAGPERISKEFPFTLDLRAY
ncbi:MAG: transglutaminase family protein [Burkholderiales bacterium]|nr:transglutaminase family protein [Phycisphaerae bacterium]